jgi:alkylation response protein AidB-like acyl-CoA dehydrogenase
LPLDPKGCSFLIDETDPLHAFTPEDFSEEHLMIRDLARRFVTEDVVPQQDRIERQEWDVTTALLRRCGELGLLGIEVPEEYGGMNLDKVSASLVAQEMSRNLSFGVTYGGQAGIGTLPIAYFGNEELKSRYLPSICRGETITAYALSESGSASDALAAKAIARTNTAGGWMLRGEKVWITNAAFADLFVTFAQIDGTAFSAFVVDKNFSGVSTGPEEHKMGLKGSSTRTLLLDDVPVPADHLLGEAGKGHRVAFGTLNTGRAKLAAMSVGAGRSAMDEAVRYAKQRTAFGKPIASFGAIQHKLAEMATRLWVLESMVYRTANLLQGLDPEYAMECSILKVVGSEALGYAADEAVQVFGGYGFTSDYPVERYYRDARVFRIFEGTNEINRMLIGNLLFKRSVYSSPASSAGTLAGARKALEFVCNLAAAKFGAAIKEQQELLMHLADMAIEIFAMDSALLRSQKSRSELHSSMTEAFTNDAWQRLRWSGSQAVAAISDTPMRSTNLSELDRRLRRDILGTTSTRRRIAEHLLDQNVQ